MKKISLILVLLGCLFYLSGCFDNTDINKRIFVTSIGLDYDELEQTYIVHYHVTNPFTLATIEAGALEVEFPYSIATGKGDSVFIAMIDILESTPQHIDLSHVQSYIMTKDFLTYHNLFELYELIRTNPILFPTPCFFVTDSDIMDVFSITNTEGLSPLFTLLADVRSTIPYDRTPFIEVATTATSQHKTFTFPIISASKEVWSTDGEDRYSVHISGRAFMSQQGDLIYLSDDDYQGLYWLNNLTHYRTEFINFSFIVQNYSYKIKHLKDNQFKLKIRFQARAGSNQHQISKEDIKFTVIRKITDMIARVFEETRAKNIDLFNLDDLLYRKGKVQENSILPDAQIIYDIDFILLG